MFQLTITTVFSAAHALLISGVREPLHGHDWHVTITIAGDSLDPDGLLVDFHAVHALLADTTAPLHNRNLNDTPPFDRLNPSAENVAHHIATTLQQRMAAALPELAKRHVHIGAATVTEAPGCTATYRP